MFRRFSSLPPLRWILLGALVLRLAAAIGVQIWVERQPQRLCLIEGDAEGYWELARHVARGESFALYDPPRFVMRMPGFPLFLAGIMKLFGERILLTRILLACVGTVACWLVYWLGRELADEAIGRISALLAALSPTMTVFSVLLLSETLFALTLLASPVGFARLIRAKRPRQALFAALFVGLFCGLATLVRPTWFVVAPAFALVASLRLVPRWQKLADAALILVAFSGVMAPWTIRNARVTGHFVPTTLWVGPSLYDGLSPQANGASDMRFIEKDGIYRNPGISEFDADQHYRRAAWDFVRAHPGRAAELTLIKLGRFWSPFPNADQFAHWAIRLGVGLYELPVLLLAAIGAWMARKDPAKLLLAAGPALYFALVHALFVGSMRYRLPAEHALLVLSALTIKRFYETNPGGAVRAS